MQKTILIHGSGHKASSWQTTISFLDHQEDILCPELSAILNGREASFPNLRAAFAQYCARAGVPIHLCGLSLGGHPGPGLCPGPPGEYQDPGAHRHAPQGPQRGICPPEYGVPPSA